MPTARLIHGDCWDVLVDLLFAGFQADAVVCDPPYHLTSIVKRFGSATAAPAKHGRDGAFARASRGFMGQTWDGGDVAADPETWARVFEVMKPGAYLLAFGGTRTYHRMTCAIEDAGFDVRDMAIWLYGQGFPKSHDAERVVAKHFCTLPGRHYGRVLPKPQDAKPGDHICPPCSRSLVWEGWGTALKPACEPICLARKPLIGTVAENVLAHGVGALAIDDCRVPVTVADLRDVNRQITRNVRGEDDGWGMNAEAAEEGVVVISPKGRWPANVLHDGSDEVVGGFPIAPGQQRDLVGHSRFRPAGRAFGDIGPSLDCTARNDTGTAARFFYCAKATKTERAGSKHPTVKPLALIQYLTRLVTPPGGTVLDPFAGSGTTGEAAILEGFNPVLIEQQASYLPDIERRLERVKEWM